MGRLEAVVARRATAAVASVALAGAVLVAGPVLPAQATACGASTFTVTRISSPILYTNTDDSITSAYEGYAITNNTGATQPTVWAKSATFGGAAVITLGGSQNPQQSLGSIANGATAYAYFYLTASASSASSESHTIDVYTTRPDLATVVQRCTTTQTMTAATSIGNASNKINDTGNSVVPASPQVGGTVTLTVDGDGGTLDSGGVWALTPASYTSWAADTFQLTSSSVAINGVTFNNTLFPAAASGNTQPYIATYTFSVQKAIATTSAVTAISFITSGASENHTTVGGLGNLPAIPASANNATISLSGTPAELSSAGGAVTYTVTVANGGTSAIALDDIVVTLAPDQQSFDSSFPATWNGVVTTAPDISSSGSTLTFLGPLSVPASSSRVLVFRENVPGILGPYSVSAVGHVGSTVIYTTTTGTTPATTTTTVLNVALTPTFSTTSPTADGFTVQIGNYDAAFTWAGSATAGGTVAVSGTGLVTVTGVAPATASTATITSTRSGYIRGTADTTATSSTPSDNWSTIIISSPATGLAFPIGIVQDSTGMTYVANLGNNSVTTYAAGTDINDTPVRTISGPTTQLSYPAGLFLDQASNLYVTNAGSDSITVYSLGANGNVAPIRQISGSETKLSDPGGIVRDSSGNLYVTNYGDSAITVFASNAEGNVAPIRRIAGPDSELDAPAGIMIDTDGNLRVANSGDDSITGYAPDTNGDVKPLSRIKGPATALDVPTGIVQNAAGRINVTNFSSMVITSFDTGATGNATPIEIFGAPTEVVTAVLEGPFGIALDPTGNMYITNSTNNSITIQVSPD